MEKPFAALVRQAGLEGTGVSLHTLRHTFASRLVQAGVDLRTVQELGGWSELSMVQRYAHVGPSHKAEAVRRIGESFHNAFHNTPMEANRVAGENIAATA
jgi:site-specific recombinase XerD